MLYYILNFYNDNLDECLEENIHNYLDIFNIQYKERLMLDIAKDTLSSYRICDLCDNLVIYACYNAISTIVLQEYGVELKYNINGISDSGFYAKNKEGQCVQFTDTEDFYSFYFYNFIADNNTKDIIKNMQKSLQISTYVVNEIITDILSESLESDNKMIIEKVIQSIKDECE